MSNNINRIDIIQKKLDKLLWKLEKWPEWQDRVSRRGKARSGEGSRS